MSYFSFENKSIFKEHVNYPTLNIVGVGVAFGPDKPERSRVAATDQAVDGTESIPLITNENKQGKDATDSTTVPELSQKACSKEGNTVYIGFYDYGFSG